ncbi:unnamed protein product [Ixodes persulcatus]
MVHCAVVGCGSRSHTKSEKLFKNKRDLRFFKIPKVRHNECDKTRQLSEKQRSEWISRLRRADLDVQNADKYKVCSKHFVTGPPAALFDSSNPDWAPSLSLGYERRGGDADSARYERQKARSRAGKDRSTHIFKHPDAFITGTPDQVVDEVNASPARANTSMGGTTTVGMFCSLGCQTETTAADIRSLEQEIARLNEEVYALRKKVKDSRFTAESFKGDDEKVSFYTGLPGFVMLMGVFTMLEAHVQHSSQNSLGKFEEMMVFLMRLRLYLSVQDLAYRFQISASTVSRVFEKWLNVFYDRLSPLIRWPTTDQLAKTMPTVFRENFGTKVTVILDCFEVFIDRPSSLITRAATWS